MKLLKFQFIRFLRFLGLLPFIESTHTGSNGQDGYQNYYKHSDVKTYGIWKRSNFRRKPRYKRSIHSK